MPFSGVLKEQACPPHKSELDKKKTHLKGRGFFTKICKCMQKKKEQRLSSRV